MRRTSPDPILLHPALLHGQPRQARPSRSARDLYLDGMFAGFFWGVIASATAWFVLSGSLVRVLIFTLRSILALP